MTSRRVADHKSSPALTKSEVLAPCLRDERIRFSRSPWIVPAMLDDATSETTYLLVLKSFLRCSLVLLLDFVR